jgi:hypothetical protein
MKADQVVVALMQLAQTLLPQVAVQAVPGTEALVLLWPGSWVTT